MSWSHALGRFLGRTNNMYLIYMCVKRLLMWGGCKVHELDLVALNHYKSLYDLFDKNVTTFC